jgi:asparagine synthase (glutamine-hydrolysing)
LRVPFTPVWVEDAAYLDEWPQTFAAAGEPIGNSGGLLVYWLCRAVSRTHKVVLSGQGADEPLGGYPRHVVERVRPIGRFAPRASAWLADRLLGLGAGRRLLRVLGAVDRRDRYLEILAVLEPRLVDTLVPGGPPARDLGRAAIERWLPEHGSADELNDLLRVDARLSLADDLLMVADQFSMRASVELRVPFLDLQLLELIERMPSRYKVSRIGERKWLYRRTAARRLPADLAVTVRGLHAAWGRKWGFTAPIERWFGGNARLAREPREWVDPLITRGLLSPPAVSAFVAEAGRDGAPWQRELLALYALSCWVSAATTPASGPDA